MATSNIKRIVSNAIANYLAENVTGLSGRVSAVQEGPEKIAEFPSVALLPAAFKFEPSDPDFVDGDDDSDNPLVIDVGEFEGIAELQLYAKSKPERELYEQRIMDLFLSQQDSPGTLFVDLASLTIGGLVTLYAPTVKVRLENAEWSEEFSFESKRYSFLDLAFAFPALVARDATPIHELQIALSDITSDTAEDLIAAASLYSWPETAADLRDAIGVGSWSVAWKFDQPRGYVEPAVGQILPLFGRGDLILYEPGGANYLQPGVFYTDYSVELDGDAQGFGPGFNGWLDLDALESIATLLVFTGVGTPVADQALKSKGTATVYRKLTVNASGHLTFAARSGGAEVSATIAVNHWDGEPHCVVCIIDREAQVLQVISDLGSSSAPSITTVGAMETVNEPWSIGMNFDIPLNAARMLVHYAAIADAEIQGIRSIGSSITETFLAHVGV